jgi:hypothetical protein
MPEMPEGYYSRLCRRAKGDWGGHDDAVLENLAIQMRDSPSKRHARAAQNNALVTMPSGYVYFGQFIDHDVTKDNRYLAEAIPCVEKIANFRTASLDLDCLYGKDPTRVPCIYEDDKERLKLGSTLAACGLDGQPIASSRDDLPRLADGRAVVVDPRNDENLIVAQLHVLFAKFHNCALELLRHRPDLSPIAEESLFENARRFVTWHYQWLVINDFLPRVARQVVLKKIKKAGSRPLLFKRWYTPADAPVSLPVEFSAAAFRFGHSMVRHTYDLNRYIGGVNAGELLRMTYRGCGVTTQLPANYVVDWTSFFGSLPGRTNLAENIDASISEMLYDIPKQTEDAFRFQTSLTAASHFACGGKMIPALPEMTLKRGSKMRLPSGEEFARRFKRKPIDPIVLFPGQNDFFAADLNRRTPLWYYLLREAEVEPNPESPLPPPINRQLQKLGTLGSRIVSETLYQLLKADSESISNKGRKWKPPKFTFRPARVGWCITCMADLIRFVEAVS